MTMQRFRWLSSREHGELRLERVGDIGAFRGRLAGRDQEQPLQLEGVVDANRAGVAHVCGDERAEGREPLFLEGQRVERRQSPILSLRPEKIGRRADRETFAEPLRTRPDLGAAAVGAHREVAVEADVHPGGARAPAGRLELAIREPLQPGMERDPLRVIGAEAPDRGRGGGAVRLRPFAEPGRTLGAEMLRERLEGGVVLERRPELAAEGVEGRIAARLERRPQRVEDGPQDLPDAGVIDELSLAQRGDARALLVERGAAPGLPRSPGPRPGRCAASRGTGARTANRARSCRGRRRKARGPG